MERQPLVVGNWKMELSHKGELEVARALKRILKDDQGEVSVVVCPSYPSLPLISETLRGVGALGVGAQHVHWEEKGPVTGAVSVLQISPFAAWCIVGHSEVRALTGQGDEEVAQAMSLLLRQGITPIVCIGESQEEREADQTVQRITAQMEVLLGALNRTLLPKIVLCYEPIWAISANNPSALPEPGDVAGIMLLARKLATARFGGAAAERLRIVYGGSVNPSNVASYVKEPGVDGVLVGGASLQPRKFFDIILAVRDAG